MFKWNCSGCNNWKKSVWHSFLTNRHHQHNYKSVMYIVCSLCDYYVMYCCQDAAGQQGQWHHQHRLRGPAGQVSCDWSEYHNTDLWLAGQDRAAHGHRQREPGDGGGVAREQGGDQGRAAARHQWGVCGGGGGAAGPWGVHTCGGRALGELGVEFSTFFTGSLMLRQKRIIISAL